MTMVNAHAPATASILFTASMNITFTVTIITIGDTKFKVKLYFNLLSLSYEELKRKMNTITMFMVDVVSLSDNSCNRHSYG